MGCVIEESQRYLRLEHEDKESYVSYFTVNAIVGELDFPSSEIFYFQQQQFTFPVDTSMNVEIVENRKALTTVRNKKKELKDLDNHAYQAGSETSSNVVDALDSVDELETDLDQSKESMYKLSYVIRVSAPDLDELKRRCDEVKDFYDDLNVKLVRPAGDMLGLHSEFLPASKRYINDYVQYVKSDFLAGLGFGATQQLGETTGIYMGYSVDTGRNVYLQPSLASQGVKGTVTNALASAFVGSLGGGKSFCNNLLVLFALCACGGNTDTKKDDSGSTAKVDTNTVSVGAVVIARDDVPTDEIYAFVSTIFENLDAITAQHAKGALDALIAAVDVLDARNAREAAGWPRSSPWPIRSSRRPRTQSARCTIWG